MVKPCQSLNLPLGQQLKKKKKIDATSMCKHAFRVLIFRICCLYFSSPCPLIMAVINLVTSLACNFRSILG